MQTLGIPGHAWPDQVKMTRLIWSFHEHQTANKNLKTITQIFFEILVIKYSQTLWTCLGMPKNTHLKWHDQFEAFIIPNWMWKITHMWRRIPQNFCLAIIDELEKQLFIKKTVEVDQQKM